jgi:hypothetical protein
LETPESILRLILSNEKERIRASYSGGDVIIALVEIIRSLDCRTYILGHSSEVKDINLLEKYKYGWALPFELFFNQLTPGDVPVFPSLKDTEDWADSVIQHGGSIQICQQFLDYKTAGLMDLESEAENHFTFSYSTIYTDEYYDKSSLAFYHSVTNKMLEDKTIAMNEKLPLIREKLKSIVRLMYGQFISYTATPELDDFYTTFGYLYLMTTQVIDEFDEADRFGDYSYKDYIDIGEYICKSGIMHRDCCMALAEKHSHKVNLRNILSYCFSLERFSSAYSDYLGWPKTKVKDLASCFCLTKENASYHLGSPKPAPPPYFRVGQDMVIQSVFGCLDRPIYFLNRELKRKFPKDYFNAVNNREKRFKQQLYSFFKEGDRFITLQENVYIKTSNSETDIDAVIFDKERKALALFQLKWQDSFYSSMKERFSRISNLIPKSVEWLDKVDHWLKENSKETIANILKAGGAADGIDSIYLFVIARNHVHFTDQQLDERAVWGSWYQVVEAFAKMKKPFGFNPIHEFASEMKLLQPSVRREMEEAEEAEDGTFRFASYTVSVKERR